MLNPLRALCLRSGRRTRLASSNRRSLRPTTATTLLIATTEEVEPRVLLSAVASAAEDYADWRNETFTVDSLSIAADIVTAQSDQVMAYDSGTASLIGLDGVFASTSFRGTGYSVAVIDTGIDYNHTALGNGWGNRVIAGYDFVNNDADPMDDNGHGTHVAGIIGSSDATYSGIAPDVNLIALKVLDANGSGSFGDVEDALQWVIGHQSQYNIVAVNLSLGAGNYSSNPYTFLEDEFQTLNNEGVFIASASGNSYYSDSSQQGLGYPAISPLTVSVGAVWDANVGSVSWSSGARDYTTAPDRVTSFTQRSSSLDILAPGAFVTSTYPGGGYATLAGTSMATPIIAGAAALLHQAAVETGQSALASQTSLLNLMQATGVDVVDGDDENDNVVNTGYTFKRLDLLAAMTALVGEPAPANNAPTINTINDRQQLAGNGAFNVAVSASDPDGDTVTLSASLADGSTAASVAFNGSTLTVTPNSDFMGQFEVLVTASDGELSTQTSFTVTIDSPLDVRFNPRSGMLSIRMKSPGSLSVGVDAGTVVVTHDGFVRTLDGVAPGDVTRLTVYGTDGDDAIDLSQVTSPEFSRLRSVYLYGFDGDDSLTGSDFDDRILAGLGNDSVNGGAGNDQISGDDGNDQLSGDDGADRISGGNGDDQISGGDGNDRLNGDRGDDTLTGGVGNDVLYGGLGNDLLRGDEGNDRLSGDWGDDSVDGGSGNDYLYGGDGNDVLSGADGHDRLYGLNGDDTLLGGDGNDALYGGAGNDQLDGNLGSDFLYGGPGLDVVSLESLSGDRLLGRDYQAVSSLVLSLELRSLLDLV
ncbi:S8 family serine peptidase [bacterium]|nr:S8 family serine peptidase [bacterium]